MLMTVVIRVIVPDTNAAKGIFESIKAKLLNIPNLKLTGQVTDTFASPPADVLPD